jgi:hypothetical protein
MDAGSHPIKDFAAWTGEKTSRIKLGFSPTSDFELFESLETLALGIQGMLSLWHALRVVTLADPRLGHLDFTELIARAEAQYEKVEDLRLSTATPARSQARNNCEVTKFITITVNFKIAHTVGSERHREIRLRDLRYSQTARTVNYTLLSARDIGKVSRKVVPVLPVRVSRWYVIDPLCFSAMLLDSHSPNPFP